MRWLGVLVFSLWLMSTGGSSPLAHAADAPPLTAAPPPAPLWVVPDLDKLPDDAMGKLVRRGRELIVNTAELIGPLQPDPAKRYAGAGLNCGNCHLEGGTKKFGIPYVSVYGDYPQYRAREGDILTLEDRVNNCIVRSLNGQAMPVDSRDMKAILSYMKFLSTGTVVDKALLGRGSGTMPELTRRADPIHGQEVFQANCIACHGDDGLGKHKGNNGELAGYLYPPLWGPESFNTGAGMNRLIEAANFIHANMPNGTTWEKPTLSVDDAWDVASYMLSQPRPVLAHLDQDYPVRAQKNPAAAYPPYAEGLTADDYRLGPFAPVRAVHKALIEKMAAEKAAAAQRP